MKYEALKSFLAAKKQARVRMSFAQVARVTGAKLPNSAYRYPAWWANDPKHHVQARAWLEAGFATENVDLERQSVEFVRVNGVREVEEAFAYDGKDVRGQHPLIGWMKGTFTIEPGYDLTRPALDEDELAEWEASLERKADLYSRGRRNKP